jgi:hypothetical protein
VRSQVVRSEKTNWSLSANGTVERSLQTKQGEKATRTFVLNDSICKNWLGVGRLYGTVIASRDGTDFHQLMPRRGSNSSTYRRGAHASGLSLRCRDVQLLGRSVCWPTPGDCARRDNGRRNWKWGNGIESLHGSAHANNVTRWYTPRVDDEYFGRRRSDLNGACCGLSIGCSYRYNGGSSFQGCGQNEVYLIRRGIVDLCLTDARRSECPKDPCVPAW